MDDASETERPSLERTQQRMTLIVKSPISEMMRNTKVALRGNPRYTTACFTGGSLYSGYFWVNVLGANTLYGCYFWESICVFSEKHELASVYLLSGDSERGWRRVEIQHKANGRLLRLNTFLKQFVILISCM